MKINVQLTIEVSDEWAAEEDYFLVRQIEKMIENNSGDHMCVETTVIERADS